MPNRIKGLDEMRRNIQRVAAQIPEVLAAALYVEAEIEMAEMKARTPVDTGALRATGRVERPEWTSRTVRVELGFGSSAVPYALVVHEDLDAFHTVGQAKYLESVLNESAPYIAARVARRIALE